MPPMLIRDFPNELILTLAAHLAARDLYSLILVSHRFHILLRSRLLTLALCPPHAKAALYWAVATGNRHLAAHILERSKHVVVTGGVPATNSESRFEWIMRQGIDLVLMDTFTRSGYLGGWKPILWAVKNRHHALLRLVIDNFDVHTRMTYPHGIAVLEEAAGCGNKTAVEILLSKGVQASERSSYSLKLAVCARHTEVAKLLLEKGANVNATFQKTSVLQEAAKNGDEEMIRLLLDKGANINARNMTGRSALHLAALAGLVGVARILVERGASVDSQDRYGWSPLHLAVKHKRVELVELLRSVGADVNLEDKKGETPLDLMGGAGSKRWAHVGGGLHEGQFYVFSLHHDTRVESVRIEKRIALDEGLARSRE